VEIFIISPKQDIFGKMKIWKNGETVSVGMGHTGKKNAFVAEKKNGTNPKVGEEARLVEAEFGGGYVIEFA
jgi:hypothetical protein